MSVIQCVKTPLLWVYLIGFIGLQAHAQPFSERADWSTLHYGLGGASATPHPTSGGFLTNPATLGAFEGSSAFGAEYQRLQYDLSSWSVSMLDGTKGIVGGLQFQWVDQERPRRHTYSAGVAYRTSWVWLGTSVNIQNFDKVDSGKGWHLTNSLGLLIPIPGGLMLGAYGKSLLDRERDSLIPPLFAGGASYSIPQLGRLYVETSKRFKTTGQGWNLSYGGEYLMKEFFALRGGFYWNRSKASAPSFWSAGAALAAPKINLAFTFSQTTERVSQGYSVDASIKF